MDDKREIIEIAKGIQGWLTDAQVLFLYDAAIRAEGGAIVEIGSFCGKSTTVLAMGTRKGNSLPIYAIDPHIGSIEQHDELGGRSSEEIFRQNIQRAGVAQMVIPVVRKSTDVGREWNRLISFLWIDGDHSYEVAKADFDLFSPWVIGGGLIAFHDCDGGPVARAMAESFGKPGFGSVGIVDTITYAVKGDPKTLGDHALLACRAFYPRIKYLPGVRLIKNRMKRFLARAS